MALHPEVYDSLRTSRAAEVARTVICWPPLSLEAGTGGRAPGRRLPAGALTQAQPRAWVLWKAAKEPMVPVKAQWGEVTPYCNRPSRATAPVWAVKAVGVPTDSGVLPEAPTDRRSTPGGQVDVQGVGAAAGEVCPSGSRSGDRWTVSQRTRR